MDFNERKLKQIKKIPEELYVEKWQDQYFGSQKINSVQVFLNFCFVFYCKLDIKNLFKVHSNFEIHRAPSELLLPNAKKSAQKGWIGQAG